MTKGHVVQVKVKLYMLRSSCTGKGQVVQIKILFRMIIIYCKIHFK